MNGVERRKDLDLSFLKDHLKKIRSVKKKLDLERNYKNNTYQVSVLDNPWDIRMEMRRSKK